MLLWHDKFHQKGSKNVDDAMEIKYRFTHFSTVDVLAAKKWVKIESTWRAEEKKCRRIQSQRSAEKHNYNVIKFNTYQLDEEWTLRFYILPPKI